MLDHFITASWSAYRKFSAFDLTPVAGVKGDLLLKPGVLTQVNQQATDTVIVEKSLLHALRSIRR
jgi:hypothetical protein